MNSKTFKNFFTGFAILGIIIVMVMALIAIWGDISPEFMWRTLSTYVICILFYTTYKYLY